MQATNFTNAILGCQRSTQCRGNRLHSSQHLAPMRNCTAAPAAQSDTITAASDSAPSTSHTSNKPSSLSVEQQPGWQESVDQLQGMGFSQVEAEQRVQRAFGWGAKARSYWRHEKSEQPPNPQQIQAVTDFLQQQLGMSEQQVTKVVKLFPEVLGCDVQQQLQGNVEKLQREWKLQGSVLTNAVLRNPPLLGYNVDCEGNCAGECNRCWVRF